ncbi:MAG: ribose-phosphate pyrophosphokinase, partial [Chloroflexi bacterium]|nr:ribose-phosphate pyrophosphokinase [Chloroflexota bacterium]
MPVYHDELKVFTGRAHPNLAEDVCRYLDIPLGEANVFKFSNDNTFVQFKENIRQRDVFLIQPFAYPVNDHVMELLIMLDAAKRASAGRITAVIPYYGYGRSDKKDQPRVPITARLIANLLETAGADRVLTIDLHAGQIQGFFNIPVDELTALPILARYVQEKELQDIVVVATDIGASKRVRNMAARLNAPLAIMEKRRLGNSDQTEALNIIGEVSGKTAVIAEDEVVTGGTMINSAKFLEMQGVHEIYACCTHAILSAGTLDRIAASNLKELVVTDTLPL